MLFTILSSLFGAWWIVIAAGILYLLLSKPNCYILDISPTFFKIPLPASEDRAYNQKFTNIDASEELNPEIQCPKSLARDKKGNIYTGSLDGKLFRINPEGQSEIISRFDGNSSGRPLGVRYSEKFHCLYFIEANSGLYHLDLNDNKKELLLHLNDCRFLDGKPSKFFDDLVLLEEIDKKTNKPYVVIYITDVSRKFSLSMWVFSFLEPDSSGRILKFDTRTRAISVILDNLCFPNGIEITKDKQSLLICELAKRRIIKHDVSGKFMGVTSVFMDNLPGEPENIRQSANSNDTYWIGLALARDYRNQSSSFVENYSSDPQLRKLILRTSHLYGLLLTFLGEFFKREEWKSAGKNLSTGLALIMDDFMTKPGMALEINRDGNVLFTLRKKTDMSVVSEILEIPSSDQKRLLYIGSSSGQLKRIVINS